MTQNYVFMTENDINLLHNFQNYTGRQCSPIFPSQGSFSGLGWIWSKIFIYIKKNFFLSEPLQISKMNLSIKSSSGPEHNSAVPCTLVYEKIARMIYGIRIYSKAAWKGRCGTELECWEYRLKIQMFLFQIKDRYRYGNGHPTRYGMVALNQVS